MKAPDVIAVVRALEGDGLPVWLDGGWGIDALLGAPHRAHDDLDLVVDATRIFDYTTVLARLGYEVVEDHLPTRLVLRADASRHIDLHPVTFDSSGTGWQAGAAPDGRDCAYPADGFTVGAVEGLPVGCLTAALQVAHHQGYPPTPKDQGDLLLLAESFGIGLPPPG